jgi:hypothetical protein
VRRFINSTKFNAAYLVFILMVFSALVYIVPNSHAAENLLILPDRAVTIETFNGTSSFFLTKLTNVPGGYDVTNKTYYGWCIDRTAEMARSPAKHEVLLYSSLNPPSGMSNQRWDLVNYILNHKQGSDMDVQNAIWHFVSLEGNYSSFQSETAWALVSDALANGIGYTPEPAQITAVICYPVPSFSTDSKVQISIIEVVGDSLPSSSDVLPTVSPSVTSIPNGGSPSSSDVLPTVSPSVTSVPIGGSPSPSGVLPDVSPLENSSTPNIYIYIALIAVIMVVLSSLVFVFRRYSRAK